LLTVGVWSGFSILESKRYVLSGGFGLWVVGALTSALMHALLGARCVGPGDGVVHAHRLEGLSPDRLRGAKFAVALPIIFRFNYDFRPLPHDYNPKLTWPSQLLILSLKIPQARAAPSVLYRSCRRWICR
jgi:hypothetical protein